MTETHCDLCGLGEFIDSSPGLFIKLTIGPHLEIPRNATSREIGRILRDKHFCSKKCLFNWITKNGPEFKNV